MNIKIMNPKEMENDLVKHALSAGLLYTILAPSSSVAINQVFAKT